MYRCPAVRFKGRIQSNVTLIQTSSPTNAEDAVQLNPAAVSISLNIPSVMIMAISCVIVSCSGHVES